MATEGRRSGELAEVRDTRERGVGKQTPQGRFDSGYSRSPLERSERLG